MAFHRTIDVKPIAGELGADSIGVDVKRVNEETFAEVHPPGSSTSPCSSAIRR